MKHSVRQYYCALCHNQVFVCSSCDRGQIYCPSVCSLVARKESSKKANQRYQKTLKGKLNNALRQKRFRQRSKNLVTDQGTHLTQQNVLLPKVENNSKKLVIEHEKNHIQCSFCKEIAADDVRNVFLHQLQRKKSADLEIYSQPP